MIPEIIWLSEQALIVRFGHSILPEVNNLVMALAQSLQQRPQKGIREWTPSYTELLIAYQPATISFQKIRKILLKRAAAAELQAPESRLLDLPVCYSGQYAPDLSAVARHCRISEDELIRRHSLETYRVYMLGFSPGFCYLGGLDQTLFTPRLKEPRLKVPAGSVGIADQQTGIYSMESPGGWRIIGRCPLPLFSPHKPPFFLINAGDRIQFREINATEFIRIEKESSTGLNPADSGNGARP